MMSSKTSEPRLHSRFKFYRFFHHSQNHTSLNMAAESVMKRKRVSQACEKCRAMKAKCDGKRPECSRCLGYGFDCFYSQPHRLRSQVSSPVPLAQKPNYNPNLQLNDGLIAFDTFIQTLRTSVPEFAVKLKGDADLMKSMEHARNVFLDFPNTFSQKGGKLCSLRPSLNSGRYLGDSSDIRFVHMLRSKLVSPDPSNVDEDGMETYDQEDPVPKLSIREVSIDLPSEDLARKYLDVYFTTIHIAYPFIPKSKFLQTYQKLGSGIADGEVGMSWLALLYIVFAIGSYYTTFPKTVTSSGSSHIEYYQRALSLSSPCAYERSLTHVSFLLAQCFYLLMTSKADECWTTLGIAVRISQSIGLHTEEGNCEITSGNLAPRDERKRRLWYSLYVLDRLIALQLGRPPAIHDEDCRVRLPSRIDDASIDWTAEKISAIATDSPSLGDYFLCVIRFSKVLGHVLRDLYGAKKSTKDKLVRTEQLDSQLLEWKRTLPRVLRFDIGHPFEKSLLFRKQRNMLAIKYHHLRALIYRPFLRLNFLIGEGLEATEALSPGQQLEVKRNERVCIAEAQETAHLLHNIPDEKSLVHDFPWWQMISCLFCASSILLVATVFALTPSTDLETEELNLLHEDAKTCIKAFEVLATNSNGARIAMKMLQRFNDFRPATENNLEQVRKQSILVAESGTDCLLFSQPEPVAVMPDEYHLGLSDTSFFNSNDSNFHTPQAWPPELWDAMTWSVQFFDTSHETSAPT
ncbi:uncharacterized protein PV09_05112 [Verruconis gallopava]|uniref:Zn(2)-C6 fungal-type domain-containing protein n=1 Tax=Verruconis gallopava TaxID=253628 RepID=A0A0D1YT49_9PEZI|nr:uncharacterized protein PV09_05112 [Verruconis gallopava]KIW03812.1 hypothetical protein PV09_05112 [Verruconis gallopava]